MLLGAPQAGSRSGRLTLRLQRCYTSRISKFLYRTQGALHRLTVSANLGSLVASLLCHVKSPAVDEHWTLSGRWRRRRAPEPPDLVDRLEKRPTATSRYPIQGVSH
jgi:hypothetical protein